MPRYILTSKYFIKCKHHYSIAVSDNDCCSNPNPNCKGWPCITYLYNDTDRPEYNKQITEECMKAIDDNDLTWAVQNIQSNNIQKKVVSKYLMDNHND